MTTPQNRARAISEAERVQDALISGDLRKLEIEIRYAIKDLGRTTDVIMANALLSIASDQFGEHPPDLLANLMRGMQNAAREGLARGALCDNDRCRAPKDLSRQAAPGATHCPFCGTPLEARS